MLPDSYESHEPFDEWKEDMRGQDLSREHWIESKVAFAEANQSRAYCVRTPLVEPIESVSDLCVQNVTVGVIGLFIIARSQRFPALRLTAPANGKRFSECAGLHWQYPEASTFDTSEMSSQCPKVELVYDGCTLLSIPAKVLLRHGGCWIWFAGAWLLEEKFRIHEYSPPIYLTDFKYLVTIQPPTYSQLELAINERVPGEVEDLHANTTERIQRSGISAPLLAMDDGWAIGGHLARRVIARMKQTFAEEYRSFSLVDK
jgi:hypothetical protein